MKKLNHINTKYQRVFNLVLLFVTFFSINSYTQGNASAFESGTSVTYDHCTGEAFVQFPVRDGDGSNFGDVLRYIQIRSLLPGESPTIEGELVFSMTTNYVTGTTCSSGPTITPLAGLDRRTYYVCERTVSNDYELVDGDGLQKDIKVTIKDLRNGFFGSAVKFQIVGVYDLECCYGGTEPIPPSSVAYTFDFTKTASNSPAATVQAPTISTIQDGPCQSLVLDWNDITPPNNCPGTISYDVYKNGGYHTTVNTSEYSDMNLVAGSSHTYYVRAKWSLQNSSRVATSLPSNDVMKMVSFPNGKINVTVKTPAGLPIPNAVITATLVSKDATPLCTVPILSTFTGKSTDSNGQTDYSNIFYGHPDDEATSYNVQGSISGNVTNTILVSLDDGTPTVTADLIDNSSYVVTGLVRHLTSGCGLENAVVSAKGLSPTNVSPITPDTTDGTGGFTLALPGPDDYRFYSTYTIPGGIVKDSTDVTISSSTSPPVIINYSKQITLSGFVGGDCQSIFGSATVVARSPSGCFIASATSNASTGQYQMSLPSMPMTVSVEDYNPTTGPLVGSGPLSLTLDIVPDGATTLDFIFRTPISVQVNGFPAQVCSDIPYPIMEQFAAFPLTYMVMESTGCPVDTGYVIVLDEIGGVEGSEVLRDTIPISNGVAYDTIIPRLPNILADYSKSLELLAFAGPDLSTAISAPPLIKRAIVTGSAPRGQQFTTVSPEIPRLIIRDPPGDASSSFIEAGQTFSTTSSLYTQDAQGGNVWVKAKAGVEIALISLEAGVEIGAKFSGEAVQLNSEETLYEFTTTSRYSTSDDNNVSGKEGDVYVGAAMNLTYANSDIIALDLAGCRIDKRVELVLNPNKFETEFVYAESDITNTIIPDLQDIADDAMQTDSARHLARESIKVWNQVIAMNAELKEEALNGPLSPLQTDPQNTSYGGSAGPFEQTFTETTTRTRTIEWKQLIEEQLSLEAGFSLAGSGVKGGFEINIKQEMGGSQTTGVTTTTTTGFVFDDGDNGDLFTVDYAIDPVYGTPVFRAAQNAGKSSCPYEIGAKRDKAYFSVVEKTKVGGPGENTLNFQFLLANQSETEEVRDYKIQLVNNPDGAQVEMFGVVAQEWNYINQPYRSQPEVVEVFVSKNPANNNFHFENLEFRMFPTCDAGDSDDVPAESVYQRISAFFDSPCSDIAMSIPSVNTGFLINSASNDMLDIGISGYDYNSTINSVVMQYSPADSNIWNNSNIVLTKAGLLNNNPPMTTKSWVTSNIPDGNYDIRLKLTCPSGGNTTSTYSPRVRGVIDRTPPLVAGIPEPIDDDYADGDEISVIFNELINCNSASVALTMQPGNVPINSTFSCVNEKLVVTPGIDLSTMLRKSFRVEVTGLQDTHGNTMESYSWDFTVGEIDSDGDGYIDNAIACLGSALDFDGVNDHLQIPHQSNLNIVDADGFTLETWINPNTSSNRTIISKHLDYIVELTAVSNTVALYLSGEWQYSTGSVPLNEWSHIAISFDGATKVASFYINGSLSGQKTFTSSPFSNADSQPLIIGYQAATGLYVNTYSGRLDDLAFWDRPLTQTEVKATMSAPLAGTESNLIAYYDFNDAPFCTDNTAVSALADMASNNNASLFNFGLTGCFSNFGSQRNLDSDFDGIPDGCDVLEECFGMPGSADSDGDGFLQCADLCPASSDVSLHFDGLNDQIVVPHDNSQNVVDGDFTFSAWINREEGTNQTILSKGNGGGGTNYIFQIINDKMGLYLSDNVGSTWYYSTINIPVNKWSHVAVSYSEASDSVSFFLDGTLFTRVQDGLGVHLNEVTTPLYIGRQGHTCDCNFFEGRLDDVMIWNRNLSAFEVNAIMAAKPTGNEQGLVAYYDFNEAPACGIGNSPLPIIDQSSSSNDGTLTNFNFSSCLSNWVEGRNRDSDNDGTGDACQVLSLCPPNFANANILTGNQSITQFFGTDGILQSQQIILSPAQVTYSSLISTELFPGFEVQNGALLEIDLSGCDQ